MADAAARPSSPAAPDPVLRERLAALAAALDGDPSLPKDLLLTDPEEARPYGRDWTKVFTPRPGAVARPRTTDEVAAVLRHCHALRIPVVPSGGRTGLAGGAVAERGELVLSLERMRRIDPVDRVGGTIRVQAGAVTESVHQAAEAQGLTWPVDFASKGSSQVGGNIATNAGGVKVIRWGLTRQWVLGLEVVLADGTVLELGGALEKDNTGIDLRQLFIGSEGVLGVITEATLKLAPLPGHLDVLVFALPSLDGVLTLFERARSGPFTVSAFELFTDACLARLHRHRGLSVPFDAPASHYVLLEVEGAEAAALGDWLEGVVADELVTDGVLAQTGPQARELWELREGISESLAATGHPHKNDVSLPLASLRSFVAELESVFAEGYPDWEICLFGHIGDGNLHVNVMKPDDLPVDAFLARTHQADDALFALVRAHGGSISAEHGIGLLKKPFLHYTRSPAELTAMRSLKAALDPRGLLNPGKVFD